MCGRYQLKTPPHELGRTFDATLGEGLFDMPPRYNIAPTQPVPIVRQRGPGRRLDLVRWGLVPSWADDIRIGNRMINARSETAAGKPAFRAPMKYRRCLLPATGFYEWDKVTGSRRPFHIQMADEQPFAFAGLYEHWQDAQGNELESCAILTTSANEMIRAFHDRMPVVLPPEDHDAWLDPDQQDAAAAAALLKPYPAELMLATPITTYVNNPRHEGPRCAEPQAEPEGRG